jgi:hypothetical protein
MGRDSRTTKRAAAGLAGSLLGSGAGRRARRGGGLCAVVAVAVALTASGAPAGAQSVVQASSMPVLNWIKQAPATSPPAQETASMVYDAANGTVVLFGGGNGSSDFLGTWVWNGSDWVEQHPKTSPPGRSDASMAYDAATGTVVLFGGDAAGGDVGDTWVWSSGWVIQPAPYPSGSSSSELVGVSCPTASECMAVGNYATSAGAERALSERWNGTSWVIRSTPDPDPGTSGDALYAVSCSAAAACTAVGYQDGLAAPLAERWNGTSWTVQPTPVPAGAAYGVTLAGVSCPSATDCTAVGSYTTAAGVQQTLAEQWNGTTWAIQPTPSSYSGGAGSGSELAAVSCSSATACTAAGASTKTSGNGLTLAEGWDGSTWAVQSTPNPSGATNPVFFAVSCPSATACTGTGAAYYNNADPVVQDNLAEGRNGTGWALRSPPTPPGPTYSGLAGVSCASATACIAAGFSGGVTIAEQWNGSGWTVQSTPGPAAATVSSLAAVSCSSATRCTAVGSAGTGSSSSGVLAERYSP